MIASELIPPREPSRALASWGERAGRRMPWRESRDPYRLAVAEILLQKTRADVAQPVWSRLIERFPDAAALAEARDSEVTGIVGRLGLGSQRSARLRAMARALRDDSETMPGIGSYGAGVLALSMSRPLTQAPIDGNVARVVSRIHGMSFERGEPRKKPEVKAAVHALLHGVDSPLAALYALVDLGALVCTPRSPKCGECPISSWCRSAEVRRAS